MIKQHLSLALLIIFCTSHALDTEKKAAPTPQRPLHLVLLDNHAEETTAAELELAQKQQMACSLDLSMKSSLIWSLLPGTITAANACAFWASKARETFDLVDGQQTPKMISPHWLTDLATRLNTSGENVQVGFVCTGFVFALITCTLIAHSLSSWTSKAAAQEAKIRAEERLSAHSLMFAKAYGLVHSRPVQDNKTTTNAPTQKQPVTQTAASASTPPDQASAGVHSITTTVQLNNAPAQPAA